MEFIGSNYKGDTKNGRLEGHGVYTFPNGTTYEGQMLDGEFHGRGVLTFPGGATFAADWVRGKAVGDSAAKGSYTFADGLKFAEGSWDYCQQDDRRFYQERVSGIPPAGASLETNAGKAPSIPDNTVDVGDGYMNTETRQVFSYDGAAVLRTADEQEFQWAVSCCRGATAEQVLAMRQARRAKEC